MLFCSTHYLVFLVSVFAVYWLLPWASARVMLLLAASIFFYASWSSELALLVVATSMLDFALARGIEAVRAPIARQILLILSLAGNLGFLVYFKYANFFLAALEQALHTAGLDASFPVLKIIAPIGVSFYTFEAISYVVDVYRRKIPAERNPLHFLLFITFFPHLVSGPIVRGRDFLPQIRRPKRWNWARVHLGLQLLILGLFKKSAIGDRMAVFVEPVFANPELYRTSSLWVAVVSFAIQLYCDFSGYSDMALGAAHLLGYKLAVNFRLPYLSANISELWRRWHMSLSSWIRDYLFIPLGGSRGSAWRTNLNLIAVMTLGGLWHGANWGFVIWGLMHGCFLTIHRGFQAWCGGRPRVRSMLESHAGTALRIALTFSCFTLALVFFRSATPTGALTLLRGLIVAQPGQGSPILRDSMIGLTALLIVGHLLAAIRTWPKLQSRLPTPVMGACYAATVLVALVLAPQVSQAFLYFQF